MIRAGLIRYARAIGRWILRRILIRGLDMLLGYLEGKIDDFKRRRGRARRDRRRKWLAGRIRRWSAAYRWLARHHRSITRRVVELVDREVGSRLPEVANDERYNTRATGQRVPTRKQPRCGRRAAKRRKAS